MLALVQSASRASAPDSLAAGRALRFDGFAALQSAPTSLCRYAAARVVRSVAATRGEAADLYAVALEYAKHREFLLPPSHGRLVRLAQRAGARTDREAHAAALAAPWARDPAEVLRCAVGVEPNAAVAAAARAEAARLCAAHAEEGAHLLR